MSAEYEYRPLEGIKLVSFDIWSTLLKSNSQYKIGRAQTLMVHLEAQGVDLEDFISLMKKVDDECDELTEQTGEQFGLRERIEKIYNGLPAGQRVSELTEQIFADFDQTALQVLLTHLPQIIEADLLETLANIEKQGVKMAVVSNTGFIDGRHMRVVLEKLGILPFMSLQIFSNEVGAAKPNKLIFQTLIEKSGFDSKLILHIGDNEIADYQGAVGAGLHALHLTSKKEGPQKIPTIKSLLR